MSQTAQLLEALKKGLKARGMTYGQLAEKLETSEVSVKRLFSGKNFTLARLESICQVLDLNFFELAKMTQLAESKPQQLSLEQELALARNPKMLIYFYLLVVNQKPIKNIINKYEISKNESENFLLELDRLRIIELHEGERFRPLVSRNIAWRRNGPIWEQYSPWVKKEFLEHDFKFSPEILCFETLKLSEASLQIVHQKIDRLIKEIHELAELDGIHTDEERRSIGLVVALRQWVFSLIAKYERK